MGRRLPIGKPTPFAADDMHERISYRTKASTQITSELLGPESRNRLQNPVVCPTVVLKSPCHLSRQSYPGSALGEMDTRYFWQLG